MTATSGYPNIAFAGKAGAGKSSAAAVLQELVLPGTPAMGYERLSIAASLKRIAVEIWGPGADTDRTKLQPLGVDVRRIDPDAWLNLWMIEVGNATWPVVCDDLRFVNEWWAAKGLGFVLVRIMSPEWCRIDRLKANGKWQGPEQLTHESETAIDHLLADADHTIINDGTKLDLAESLVRILDKEARRS